MGLFAQNLLKIKTAYLFLNFDLAKGKAALLALPIWLRPFLLCRPLLVVRVKRDARHCRLL